MTAVFSEADRVQKETNHDKGLLGNESSRLAFSGLQVKRQVKDSESNRLLTKVPDPSKEQEVNLKEAAIKELLNIEESEQAVSEKANWKTTAQPVSKPVPIQEESEEEESP